MISNCGHDENNRYSGGKAGDQTGGEYALIQWYSRPWNFMIRYNKDPKVGLKISELARAAARNEHIGYDQGERYGFWEQLQKNGYDPAKISVNCEADCSSSTAAIVKAVGYLFNIDALKKVSIYCYTGNLRQALVNAGFTVYTETKYLNSDQYLLEGDILLYENHHVAVNVTKGRYGTYTGSGTTATSTIPQANAQSNVTVTTNVVNVNTKKECVKIAQKAINSKCGNELKKVFGHVLDVDGDFGKETARGLLMFLQWCLNNDYHSGLVIDGIVGPATRAALGTHYVEYGETQYMVTFVEVLIYALGQNPNGIEYPGHFGNGLKNVINTLKLGAGEKARVNATSMKTALISLGCSV